MRKLSFEEVQSKKPSIEDVANAKRHPIYVILENVRSLYNVGAIFRTSDAAMIEKLYLCGITGAPPRKEISKTALGAEELVPFEYREDAVEVVRELKEKGVQVVAIEIAHGSEPYDKFNYEAPVCIVLGHEVEGISDELMAEIDNAIEVPMHGRANSLNVATCYGIVVYEILKKLK
ncbi:TrmH family RNA methyltransferase [Candidatus Peregrinibacteria bacterium]|nr:TrmH family RNA methyltransferase [Candidatus Peregrinibacteria bacterium]